MRIVSLVPSATEIAFALGLGDDVVGVTFECDFPPDPRVGRAIVVGGLDTHGLRSEGQLVGRVCRAHRNFEATSGLDTLPPWRSGTSVVSDVECWWLSMGGDRPRLEPRSGHGVAARGVAQPALRGHEPGAVRVAIR